MATSYKTLYQEAKQEAEYHAAEAERLRQRLAAHPDENAREVERTRLVVDLAGIARHMQVERYTPQQWRQRPGLNFPPVDFPDIREPLWYASTIKAWAEKTRRVWYDNPDAEVSPAA